MMMIEDYAKEVNADLTSYELTHEKLLARIGEMKAYKIIDRAVDYIYTEMSPYTAQGEEVHEWTKEEIKEFLWDDEEWR